MADSDAPRNGCTYSILAFIFTGIFVITVFVMATGHFDGWKLTLAIVAGVEMIGAFFNLTRGVRF